MTKGLKRALGVAAGVAFLAMISPILALAVYEYFIPAPVLVRIANGSGQPIFLREVKIGPVHRRWPVHKGKETYSPLMPSDPNFAPAEPYYLFGDEAGRDMYSARYYHAEFASGTGRFSVAIKIRRHATEKTETFNMVLNHDRTSGCQFLVILRETDLSVTECQEYADESVK